MSPKTYLTASYVRSLLKYNRRTGVFTWRARKPRAGKFRVNYWNSKFAGMPAGSVGATGHIKISINDRSHLAHRLAWLIMTGHYPVEEIDHKDGNPANNRFENLREATRQQNQQNRTMHKSNRSGFKGVYKNATGGTWSAQIYSFGKKIHIGCFPTAEAAHAAYLKASREAYGAFARAA